MLMVLGLNQSLQNRPQLQHTVSPSCPERPHPLLRLHPHLYPEKTFVCFFCGTLHLCVMMKTTWHRHNTRSRRCRSGHRVYIRWQSLFWIFQWNCLATGRPVLKWHRCKDEKANMSPCSTWTLCLWIVWSCDYTTSYFLFFYLILNWS